MSSESPTEESPLLSNASIPGERSADPLITSTAARSAAFVVCATFLGEFLASADESLMTSNYSVVASEFQSLSKGSWLLVAYTFGNCVASPVCGVFGDLFGRKRILLWSYAIFALGCIACGCSVTMNQLILARCLTGLSGAGMVSLVSVVMTELLPPQDIVIYQNYTSIVNIAGRSLGAPIGGLLTQTVGWRWSFIGQIPLVLAAALVTVWQMPQSLNNPRGGDESGSTKIRLKSIDFSGITIFAVAVLSFLFTIHNFEFGEAQQSQLFYVSSATFIISLALFFMVELLWASNPLIPLDLMLTSFGAYCLSQQLINMGRSAFIPTTTPYFIRVFNVSDFTASMVNMLIMAGVPTGGYFAGYLIRRREKSPRKIGVITACFMGLIYLLIFLRWRAPCLPWETVYLIPFGFTMGILFSTQFVGMTTTVIEARIGQCIGTYALFGQLGAVIGPLFGLKLIDFIFQRKLYREIPSSSEKPALVHKILNDARFAFKLPESTQSIIRQSYLSSFQFMPILCSACVIFALPLMIFAGWKRLPESKI